MPAPTSAAPIGSTRPNQSWVPITDPFGRDDANTMGIESLALDPTDPNKVYIAAGTYTQQWADRRACSDRVIAARPGKSPRWPTRWGLTNGTFSRRAPRRRSESTDEASVGSRIAGLLVSLDASKTWHESTLSRRSKTPTPSASLWSPFDPKSGKKERRLP